MRAKKPNNIKIVEVTKNQFRSEGRLSVAKLAKPAVEGLNWLTTKMSTKLVIKQKASTNFFFRGFIRKTLNRGIFLSDFL